MVSTATSRAGGAEEHSVGTEGIGKLKDVLPALGARVVIRGEHGHPHGSAGIRPSAQYLIPARYP